LGGSWKVSKERRARDWTQNLGRGFIETWLAHGATRAAKGRAGGAGKKREKGERYWEFRKEEKKRRAHHPPIWEGREGCVESGEN
jgi:hypothetical protein